MPYSAVIGRTLAWNAAKLGVRQAFARKRSTWTRGPIPLVGHKSEDVTPPALRNRTGSLVLIPCAPTGRMRPVFNRRHTRGCRLSASANRSSA